MSYSKPITEVITQRTSCRHYRQEPIATAERQRLADLIAANQAGPFGSPTRFELVTATERDRKALRGLGTYGFVKNPTGFVIGAMGEAEKNLEDFGYAMEQIILLATDMGLGTCWLGGSFTKSRFARRIGARNGESVPAVTAIGYMESDQDGFIRQRVGGAHRRSWNKMFFEGEFGTPISREAAGPYATPLEMVRRGPSASNKQPWRIVRNGDAWHFYLQRTPGYRSRWIMKLMRIADIQRLDMGIAMCHFQLTANELGLPGAWATDEPPIQKPNELTEYVASWQAA